MRRIWSRWFLGLGRTCLRALSHPQARRLEIGRTWQQCIAWAHSADHHAGSYQLGDAKTELRLLVAGDSIACGLGLERREQSLAGLLAAALAERYRVDCLNLAVPGTYVADITRQLASLPQIDADLVLLTGGTKDLVAGHTPDRVARDWHRALAVLADVPFVFVVGSGNPADVRLMPRLLAPLARSRYRRHIAALRRALADFPNALLVEMGNLSPSEEHFSEDGYHPSASGHELIFAAVAASSPLPLSASG